MVKTFNNTKKKQEEKNLQYLFKQAPRGPDGDTWCTARLHLGVSAGALSG